MTADHDQERKEAIIKSRPPTEEELQAKRLEEKKDGESA